MVDQVYAKGYQHFKVSTVFASVYSLLKLLVIPFVLFFSEIPRPVVRTWLILVLVMSLIQIFYYFKAYKFAKSMVIFLRVAEKMRHSAYFIPE